MTNEEIKKELEYYHVQDNPFDAMLYKSLELAREILFSCSRLRNPDIPEPVCISKERLENYINFITNEFNSLMEMGTDTVTLCRETSYYNIYRDRFNELNDELLKAERAMETVWTRCNPNRNDAFEKIRLGDDSEKYKHLCYLRNVAKELCESKDNMSFEYLGELIDAIWNEGLSDEKAEIIKKYNLTENDICYIQAYLYSK